MKTKLIFSAAVCLLFCLSSCVKTEHKIRFQNSYNQTIDNVVIGSDNFGNVEVNTTTDYQSIPEGSGKVSGVTENTGQALTGGYSISGHGKHNWTATLSSSGTMSMKEDK